MGPSCAAATLRCLAISFLYYAIRPEAASQQRRVGWSIQWLGGIQMSACEELSAAAFGMKFVITNDHVSTADHDLGPSGDLTSLIWRVADIVVQILPLQHYFL